MPNDEFWAAHRAHRATGGRRTSGTSSTILLILLFVIIGGLTVFGYLALLMTLFGIGRGGLAFGITLAVTGIWGLVQRGFRPWWFRLTQAEKFADQHNWTCSRQRRETGTRTAIDLEFTGEYHGRQFAASQIDTDTSTGDPTSSTNTLSTEIRLLVGPAPVNGVEFHRFTGRVTVRANRTPDLAAAIERSDFARWLRRHRLLARTLRYDDNVLTARWSGGLYGAKLLRRLRFLTEADARLRAAANS